MNEYYNLTGLKESTSLLDIFKYGNSITNNLLGDVLVLSLSFTVFLIAAPRSSKTSAMFLSGFTAIILSVILSAGGITTAYSLMSGILATLISLVLMYNKA